jgi:hypothetical protein
LLLHYFACHTPLVENQAVAKMGVANEAVMLSHVGEQQFGCKFT